MNQCEYESIGEENLTTVNILSLRTASIVFYRAASVVVVQWQNRATVKATVS